MTVLRRSLSAPDVLLGPGARCPGSDTEQEGYEEQDDEDTMQDEKEEAGDAVVGPLSEVVCPTTGQPVQFVAQFFVTRMLGMLGVRLKRHRIIAISQDRLYLLRIEAGSSKQPKVSYPLKACSLNCDARSSSGRAFNLRSDVGSVDNGYECRARTSLLRAVSEQADRVAKQPLLQLFHAVKQRKGGRPDVRVALRVGPTTLEQRVGDSLDIIAHSLSLLWLQRIVLFSDAPQDVLLECSAGRRQLYSLQARQGLVRAIEGAINLLGVKTPPVVTRQRAELSAEQSAHAASHLPNLLYLPVLKWSSTQGCYKCAYCLRGPAVGTSSTGSSTTAAIAVPAAAAAVIAVTVPAAAVFAAVLTATAAAAVLESHQQQQ
eukprot:2367-Heterococcus_DN1.PRE.1